MAISVTRVLTATSGEGTNVAYTERNFKTKADIKRALAAGEKVRCYQPNADLTGAHLPRDGRVFLEGPHYPQPHRWYAEGELRDGYLVKIK